MSVSQTEITKTIPANGSATITTRGEFVYLKEALGVVRVMIENQPVQMAAGDFRKLQKPFDSFDIENASDLPRRVVLVVGFGEFSRSLISGSVSVEAKLQKSTGELVSDTRKLIGGILYPSYLEAITVPQVGDNLWVNSPLYSAGGAYFTSSWVDQNGLLHVGGRDGFSTSPSSVYDFVYDLKTGAELSKIAITANTMANMEVFVETPVGTFFTKDLTVNTTSVFIADGAGGTELFSVGAKPTGLAYDTRRGRLIVVVGSELRAYSLAGALLQTLTPSENYFAANQTLFCNYNHIRDEITISPNNSASFKVLDAGTFEELTGGSFIAGVISSSGGNFGKANIHLGNEYGYSEGNGVFKLNQWQPAPVPPLGGYVSQNDCENPLIRRNDIAFNLTFADIEVVFSNGKTAITGEVIKAFLELRTGKQIKAGFNYMDAIYSVKIFDPLTGVEVININNNGGTLAAINIIDDFSAIAPCQIEIKADNSIEYEV